MFQRGRPYDDDDDSTVDGTVSPNYRAHVRQQAVSGGDGYGHVDRHEEAQLYREAMRNGGGGGNGGGSGGGGGREAMLEEELEQLRQMIATTSQGTVEAKYLEQMRRNRELNVRYEAEKARTAKLAQRVVALEREKLNQEEDAKKGVLLPSQRPGVSSAPGGAKPNSEETELAELRAKLSGAQKSLASVRKQNDDLKREVHKLRKVVAIEVGDDALVEKALEAAASATDPSTPTKKPAGASDTASTVTTLNGGGAGGGGAAASSAASAAAAGWRGRAQQITLLRSKVRDLERQIAASTIVGSNAGNDVANHGDFYGPSVQDAAGTAIETASGVTGMTSVALRGSNPRDVDEISRATIAKKQTNLRSEVKELEKLVAQREEQLEREKQRADSVAARQQILERDNAHLKNCIQRIIEKTENDDKLIAAYKEELDEARREMRRLQLVGGAHGGGAARTTGMGLGPSAQALESENLRLAELVNDLRREVHTLQAHIATTSERNGTEAAQQQQQQQQRRHGGVEAHLQRLEDEGALSDGAALHHAKALIQELREALMAFDAQLQKRERGTTSGADAKALPAVVREENAALKERIQALTALMDKEIAMYKSIAENAQQQLQQAQLQLQLQLQQQQQRPANTPPIAGRRSSSSSTAAAGSRPASVGGDAGVAPLPPPPPPPSSTANAAMQDEYQQLKSQYAALKREFNSQQSQMQRMQQQQQQGGAKPQ